MRAIAVALFIAMFGAAPAKAQLADVHQTPTGILCLEGWITLTLQLMNTYDGSADYNAGKLYRLNRFGFLFGTNAFSNFEPDNWAQFGANRPDYMWFGLYTTEEAFPVWQRPEMTDAGVPGLRWSVRTCLEGQGQPSTMSGSGVPPTAPAPAPAPTAPAPVAPVGPAPAPSPAPTTPTSTFAGGVPPLGAIPPDAICPATWGPISAYPGVLLGCTCGADQMTGSVWGSGPYTYDSSLCLSAVHSGAIPISGGPIWATVGPGLSVFPGTTRFGVTTLDYGPYEPAGSILSTPATVQPIAGYPACPGTMVDQTATLTCHCAPARFGTSGIWGTGVYTHDSNICTAGLHAGVVGVEGGPVTVRPLPDAGSYAASVSNGVTSAQYGAWNGAFDFIR